MGLQQSIDVRNKSPVNELFLFWKGENMKEDKEEPKKQVVVKCTSGNCRGRRYCGNGFDVWIDASRLPEYEAGTFRPMCNECFCK